MPARILYIDNSPHMLNIVGRILHSYGYGVMTAHAAPLGVTIAIRECPDLILLDVNMPEMDGFEVCEKVRSVPALKETPIIIFTASRFGDTSQQAFEAGANDYLTKPVDPDDLVDMINKWLNKKIQK